jgi:hypothetical protein
VQLFACLALSHACSLLTTVNPFDTIPTPFAYCATLRFAGGDLTYSSSRPYSRQALSTLPLFVRIARVSWVPTALTVSRYCKQGMSTLFAYHTSVRSLTLVLKLPSSPRSSPCLKGYRHAAVPQTPRICKQEVGRRLPNLNHRST